MVTWASVRGDVPRKIRGFEVPEVRGSVEGGEVTARCEVGAGAGQTGEGQEDTRALDSVLESPGGRRKPRRVHHGSRGCGQRARVPKVSSVAWSAGREQAPAAEQSQPGTPRGRAPGGGPAEKAQERSLPPGGERARLRGSVLWLQRVGYALNTQTVIA